MSFIEDFACRSTSGGVTDRLSGFRNHGTQGTWYSHASVGTLHVRRSSMRRDGATKMRALAEDRPPCARVQGCLFRRHAPACVAAMGRLHVRPNVDVPLPYQGGSTGHRMIRTIVDAANATRDCSLGPAYRAMRSSRSSIGRRGTSIATAYRMETAPGTVDDGARGPPKPWNLHTTARASSLRHDVPELWVTQRQQHTRAGDAPTRCGRALRELGASEGRDAVARVECACRAKVAGANARPASTWLSSRSNHSRPAGRHDVAHDTLVAYLPRYAPV